MLEELIDLDQSTEEITVLKKRPKTLNSNRKIEGVQHLAGVGNKNADIMFVGPCALDEEVASRESPAALLKGPAGDLFQRQLSRVHLDLDSVYYTTLVKHALPRKQKMKPDNLDLEWNDQMFEAEMEQVKPKFIVCLGAAVFKRVTGLVVSYNQVVGGLFDSKRYNCKVYAMDNITGAIYKPEKVDKQQIDLYEVKRCYDRIKNVHIETLELDYQEITTVEDLRKFFTFLREENKHAISVDCEWGGATYVDGKLRSIQMCFDRGRARYIGFHNEHGENRFDRPYEEVAKEFHVLNSQRGLKWIGHNLAADFVWMHNHLGIDVYKKALFDTMFAEMACDEYSDLKLERLSVKYTPLGRYDIPLILTKKELGIRKDEGYERIPDEILIPYALNDVVVPYEAFPQINKELIRQDLWKYYNEITLPLVTDGFVTMMETGIPISKELLDSMRTQFVDVRNTLLEDLNSEVMTEARLLLLTNLVKVIPADLYREIFGDVVAAVTAFDYNKFLEISNKHIKPNIGVENYSKLFPFISHYFNTPNFNIRSTDNLRTWLFDVKGLTPVKTTKKDGFSMTWDKVEALPPARRKEHSPSVDKQTLKILSEDRLVYKVLEVNNVGNIIKNFLREADPETGEEFGVHKWIQSDGRIHANFALTESDRPRSWNPNILNWPKRIDKSISEAFKRLKPDYELASLRSAIAAEEGYCIVDSDLDTAEVVSLAYLADDEVMIAACTDKDEQFVEVDKALAEERGFKPFNFKKSWFIRREELATLDKKVLEKMPCEHLISERDVHDVAKHDDDGCLVLPKRDLHWELAETAFLKPREIMDEETDRGGGKVGNFSIPYGATGALLDTMIEAMTGKKPKPGTGDALKEGYAGKWKKASLFLEMQEEVVVDPGVYIAPSGKRRHFHHINKLRAVSGMHQRVLDTLTASLFREARNYPMQHMVAYHMAKALLGLIEDCKNMGLQARPMLYLYDAMSTLCPIEERFIVNGLHDKWMSLNNVHQVRGRELQYTIDTGFYYRLGHSPSKEDKAKLHDRSWRVA